MNKIETNPYVMGEEPRPSNPVLARGDKYIASTGYFLCNAYLARYHPRDEHL